MIHTNITTVTEFIILGFPGLRPMYYGVVSALLLCLYLGIVVGNLFILVFVARERSLHKPTYLIFCHLAANDLLFGTVTLPKMVSRYWWDDRWMSFGACFLQMYLVHALGAIHSLLLLIMALDRFIAVCVPLRYPALITNRSVQVSCSLSWAGTLVRMLGILLHALQLPYCDGNVIVQCYCDHLSITSLGCGDGVKFVKDVALGFAMFSLLLPLAFIISSYGSIFVVVLRVPDRQSRYKLLSTCAPQIFITCLYYLPRCFVYLSHAVDFSFSLDFRVALILVYSLFPAAVNPLIYCLKTKDIKDTLTKRFKKIKVGVNVKEMYK